MKKLEVNNNISRLPKYKHKNLKLSLNNPKIKIDLKIKT